jgi:hypothetical protein
MRYPIGCFIILTSGLSSCHSQPRLAPAPTRPDTVSAVRRSPKASTDLKSSWAAAASRVDTLLTDPQEVALRVGEAFPTGGVVVTGLDSAGVSVGELAPYYYIPRGPVAELRGGYIRGLSPGATVLYVFPTPRQLPPEGSDPARPMTRVPVIVNP